MSRKEPQPPPVHVVNTNSILSEFIIPLNGIVTINNWTMAPDGEVYLYFYSNNWRVLTDKDIPIANFHSSEKWQLIALDSNGSVIAIFPGCQVKGFVYTSNNPNKHTIYSLE